MHAVRQRSIATVTQRNVHLLGPVEDVISALAPPNALDEGEHA